MISEKEIQHLANLARLKLNQEEIKKYQKDLSSILDYFKRLERIETKGVNLNEPLIDLKNVLAKDEVSEVDSRVKEDLLKQAPVREGGFVKTRGVFKT